MLWMLVMQAWAAEPDLSGVHVALGGGLRASLGPFVDAAAVVEPSVRVHLGSRILVELSASGSRYSDQRTSELLTEDGDGEVALDRLDDVTLTGWRAAGGLRLLARVAHREGLDAYLGVAGGYATSDLSGPLEADVEEEDGEPAPTVVGEASDTRRLASASLSFAGVHWASERIAVSGTLELPLYSRDHRVRAEEIDVPRGEIDRDVDLEQSLLGAPVVGLLVHVRL